MKLVFFDRQHLGPYEYVARFEKTHCKNWEIWGQRSKMQKNIKQTIFYKICCNCEIFENTELELCTYSQK